MRAQEFISESKTASAGEVWNYVKQLHPTDQQGGGFLERLIRQYSKYQLQSVPVTDLIIYDQESDDPDEEPEQDPYGRVQVVDPEYAGEVSIHNIDRNPIVIDANGHILDGNHRAWAAAELLGRDTIQAWVPVEPLTEIGDTRPEYTRPQKQRSGKHVFTTRIRGRQGPRRVDVNFFYNYITVEVDFKVDGWDNSHITGNGDAVLILSAVRHIVEQELPKLLKKIPRLKQVRFRSYAEANSRVNLYQNRAVPFVSKILGPDWRYFGDYVTMGDSHWFYWQHRTVTGGERVRVHGMKPQEQPDEPYSDQVRKKKPRVNEQFNTKPGPVYHGNQGGIHNELTTPMWWTEDLDTAVYYATQGGADGWVYSATLTCKNPYVIVQGKDEPNAVLQKYASLVQQGYDSIYDPARGDWIPFHAKDIHVTGREYQEGEDQIDEQGRRNSGHC